MTQIEKRLCLGLFTVVIGTFILPSLCRGMDEPSRLSSIIETYKEGLPKMRMEDGTSAATDIAAFLADLIPKKSRSKITVGEEEYLPGQADVEKKLSMLIEDNKKIIFFLYGFPFKSRNLEKKCLGIDPDLGDVIALVTLQNICSEVKKRYPPGAECLVISDGPHTCDALGVPEEEVNEYLKNLSSIASKIGGDVTVKSITEVKGMPTFGKTSKEVAPIVRTLAPYKGERDTMKEGFIVFAKEELKGKYYSDRIQKKVESDLDLSELLSQHKSFENLPDSLQVSLLEKPLSLSILMDRFKMAKAHEKNRKVQNGIKELEKDINLHLSRKKNDTKKEMQTSVGTFLIEDTFCFAQYFAKYYPGYHEYFRLSINLNGFTSMTGKIPFSLLTGEEGTPWHMTPVYDSKSKAVRLMKRDKLPKGAILRMEKFACQEIKWFEVIS